MPQTAPAAENSPIPLLSRRIPATGESLPIIGLGTWQTFDAGPAAAERAPREETLAAFVAGGGKVIDSSPMYGRSEEVVGDLTAKLGLSRDKLFLATKVWTTGREKGIAQMEDSFRKLRAGKTLDLMQVHNLVDAETHLATLREWKKAGRIRYLGVTHYTVGAYSAVEQVLRREPVDFLQINYSVQEPQAEQRLLPLARDKGIAVLVNRPLAGGDLLRRLAARPVPPWAADLGCDTWPQLLLKWAIAHPAVTCAIPGTNKASHVRENLRAGTGPLPDEKLRKMIAGAVA